MICTEPVETGSVILDFISDPKDIWALFAFAIFKLCRTEHLSLDFYVIFIYIFPSRYFLHLLFFLQPNKNSNM